MTKVEATTGAIRWAKLQSNRHHQQTNNQLLQAGCPYCHPTNHVKALKGKICCHSTLQNTEVFNSTVLLSIHISTAEL